MSNQFRLTYIAFLLLTACPDEEVQLVEAPEADAGTEDEDPIPEVGSVSGRYCAPEDSVGIAAARVYVVIPNAADPEGAPTLIETTTDAEGNFLLEGIPSGTHTIYIERASFTAQRPGVDVFTGQTTPLNESNCTQPDPPRMLVYTGMNDSVQTVLEELGFTDMVIRRTLSQGGWLGDIYQNWMRTEWLDYDRIADFDIMFINCSVNDQPLAYLLPDEKLQIIDNLRRFVAEGGTIYLSDFGGDIFELLYPEAVDWIGEDRLSDGMRAVDNQLMDAQVMDPTILDFVQKESFKLTFRGSNMVVPETLSDAVRPLLNAAITVRPQVIQKPETANSCAGYCGLQHPSGCWCEEGCIEAGDCCYDYEFSCGQSIEPEDTCRGRCNQQFAENNCYCDTRNCVVRSTCCELVDPECVGDSCEERNACCEDNGEHCNVYCSVPNRCCTDFEDQCTYVEERAGYETTIAFSYKPIENDPLTSGYVVFTSFHHSYNFGNGEVDPEEEEDFEASKRFLHGLIFSL